MNPYIGDRQLEPDHEEEDEDDTGRTQADVDEDAFDDAASRAECGA